MRGLNHLVIAARDLDAISATWAGLGFTLTPRAQHPFGTGNAVIQLQGCYLELLSVTIPADIVEQGADSFSFSAFNRDYLARHEGFSMLVMDSRDAAADIAAWRAAGLKTYAPFDFSRLARMPDGEDIRVGFSLAFVSTPVAPWLGHFACQHYRPEYYAQPQYLTHANGARAVHDVWITGDGALGLARHFGVLLGGPGVADGSDRIIFPTPSGTVVLATPGAFENAFGERPPHPEDGPHLAGLTIGCDSLGSLAGTGFQTVGDRLVLPPAKAFGTAVAFIAR